MGLPTASRCHGRHDPTSVMANRGHWMLLHSIGVLGTCKLHSKISKICEFGDQWMISWWSVDDQLMISWWSMDDQLMISWWSVDDQWMINGWSVDDQLMISWWWVDDLRGPVELSEAATEGIAEGLWANSGAVVLAGSAEIPAFLATKKSALI